MSLFQRYLVIAFISYFFEVAISTRYYVDSTVSGGTGTSWSSPYEYLDDALKGLSGNSNEIWITQGTYYPQSTNRSSCFIVPNYTYIYGGFLGNETSIDERIITDSVTLMTILDGDINTLGDSNDNCYHVVEITSGMLDTLVIRNGNANKDGDGLETSQVGAAIYTGKMGVNLTLNNVQILNNTANLGAGIYGSEDNNYVKIYNSIFKDNTAKAGTYLGGYGGAIHVLTNFQVTIEDTQFINNNAVYRGGAIYQDYAALVSCENCLFMNNEATDGHGGAWFAENRNAQTGVTTATMKNCNFTLNYAYGYGGACTFFTESDVIIYNCSFDNNIAGSRGGALAFYNIINATLIDTDFINNNASNSSTNDIYNSTFPEFTYINTNNSYNLSDYLNKLWNNKIITTQYNDDLPEVNKSNLCYIKSCDSCNNTSSNVSSLNGTSWNSAYTQIQDCIDYLDSVDSINKEIWVATGTYYPTKTLPFVDKTIFSYFFSFIMAENIRMYGGFNGTETSRSQRNWYLNPTTLSCDMKDMPCTIIMDAANNVTVDGFIFTGALYNGSNEIFSSIPDNTSSTRRRLESTHSTISSELSDTTGGRGGGIFSNGTNIIVANSLFYGNLAGKGGGLYCIGYTGENDVYESPTIINSAFINNYAGRGGALMGDVYCNFECESCLFEDNYASGKGGAIYLDYLCEVYINDSVFIGNIAYESGGCIGNDGFSVVHFNNVTLSDNEAKWEGGCLYGGSHISNVGPVFYFEDTNFENNTALYGFDDIWVWLNDGVYVKETSNQTNATEPTTTTGTIFNTTFEGTAINTTFKGTETTFNTTSTVTDFSTTVGSSNTTQIITIEPITSSSGITTLNPITTEDQSSEATTIFKTKYIIFFCILLCILC